MDIKHFRYFVAVAETLSFARAARHLHVSQPPLSKRISALEEELGVRLLQRSSKMVRLTAAGEAFLEPARDVLRVFETAMRAARSLSPSQPRRLRIAFAADTSRSVVLAAVNRLQQEKVEIEVFDARTAEQQQLLASGEVDVGVLRHPFDSRGLSVSAPLGQPLGLVFASEHPLAKLEEVHLSDLKPYALVLFQRHLAPDFYDELLDLCREGGYVPPRILHAVKMMGTLLRVESAVTIMAERLFKRHRKAGSKDLVWRPMEGSPVHWWISVVRRADECGGLTRLAVEVILAALQKHDSWVPMPRPLTDRHSKAGTKKKVLHPIPGNAARILRKKYSSSRNP